MHTQYRFVLFVCLLIVAHLRSAFLHEVAFAQAEVPQAECGFVGTGTQATQLGGMWMTARDTLHVLVVFVQFPDDRYDTTYSLWPTYPLSSAYPGPTFLNTYIDSLPSQMTTNGNITNYFRQMSLGSSTATGQFTLTGKARFVVTPHSRQWYRSNGWCRWLINEDILKALDTTLDFAEFDRWKRYGAYDIRREADGRVDDVFMIYRNVAHDLGGSVTDTMRSMGFEGGESSLGYQSPCGGPLEFYVDGGLRRIGAGHPAYALDYPGMGTTSVIAGTGDGWFGLLPYRVQIHEFAHHWMTNGTLYGHNGGGFWGMLNDWAARFNNQYIQQPNSFERELVGWIRPDSIYQTTLADTLADYVTTGRAIKIKVPGSNPTEFFRLEYHLKVSQFDNPEMHNAGAKGLYIIHQTGMNNPRDQLRLLPSDGRWMWLSNEVEYDCPYCGSGLPVYRQSSIDRVNGTDDSRLVPFTWDGQPPQPSLTNPNWIHWHRDRMTGQLVEQTVFRGDGKDAWSLANNNVFTPWSNPNSQNQAKQKTWIAVEIANEISQSGKIVLNVYMDSASCVALPPSKPQDLRITDTTGENEPIFRWDDDKWNQSPDPEREPDFSKYEVWRSINYLGGPPGTFSKIATVTSNTYTDYGLAVGGAWKVYYKVRMIDTQSKASVFSDMLTITSSGFFKQGHETPPTVSSSVFVLDQNHPNPFNPATTIKFQIPSATWVTLKVYDVLGREVVVLVEETKARGAYQVQFNASGLSSGVYVYRLTAGNFDQTRTMVLLR